MKILKYKKLKDSKYYLYFDNGLELELYEDTILKYELLLNKDFVLDEVVSYNDRIKCYYDGLKFIKSNLKSVFEVRNHLLNNKHNESDVLFSVEKMISNGFLNDMVYAKSYINTKLALSDNGPRIIKSELERAGISFDIIDEVMEDFTDDIQLEKINKLINKMIISNRNKSGLFLQKHIINHLILKGYNSSLIYDVINDYSFDNDNKIYEKEKDKLRKRLSLKYSGDKLDFEINNKLRSRGFY